MFAVIPMIAAALLAAPIEVRADLTAPDAVGGIRLAVRFVEAGGFSADRAVWPAGMTLSGGFVTTGTALADTAAPCIAEGLTIRELPPVPSSSELLMSGLACLGVWHLLRGAKHWQIASFPDWYHAEGPTQVGRSYAYDFQLFALPLCCPCEPITAPRASVLIGVPRSVKGSSQQELLPFQNRGPPVRSQA